MSARVVRIIARLNVGGPAWHVIHLSRGLASRYPTLLVTGTTAPDEADLTEFARDQGVEVHRIPELGRKIRPWDDIVAFVKLVLLLRRERPDIVHTHTAKAGSLGRLAAVVARVPIRVHTFHGHVFRGYFGALASRLVVGIERALALVTKRVVTVSDSLAREISDEFRVCAGSRIRVIPLGLDLARFHPDRSGALRREIRTELGLSDRDVVVTTVGRLARVKNHELLLDAVARVRASGRIATYLIVGGGAEERRLRDTARRLGVAGDVRFLGWRSDLDRIYAASDIVALTSVNEGTPVCLIEGLASGRRVIATDVGGVRDVLANGRLGVLVPGGDAARFSEALGALIDDVAAGRDVDRSGVEEMPRRFGVDRLIADTAALYDELLHPLAIDAGERIVLRNEAAVAKGASA